VSSSGIDCNTGLSHYPHTALVAERTIIQRTHIAKLHFFLSKKSFLGGKIPKTLANVLPKAEKRKQKKTP